jgi:hypothetical protein
LAKNYGNQRLSAHGDQKDLLNFQKKQTFKSISCSYENQPADELRIKIKEQYGLTAVFHY